MVEATHPDLLLASPWQPHRSEIARHVIDVLLPQLAAHFNVRPVGTDDSASDYPWVLPIEAALQRYPDAQLLAHIGNGALQNDAAIAALAHRSGVVVLHDTVLHHAWYDACLRTGRFDDYLASVRQYGGAVFAEQAELARHHAAPVHRLSRSLPLFEPMLRNASGVVVHSQMALETVSSRGPWLVRRLELPAHMPDSPAAVLSHRQAQVRALELGGPLKIIVFGYLGANRCLRQIVDAAAALKAQSMPFTLDIFGRLDDLAGTQQAIANANLSHQVCLHGYVPEDVLEAALQHSHLAINFRSPTMGEASSSQLRLYASGLPAVVCRTGWYAEQPASAVVHVEPGHEAAGLVAAVKRLRDAPGELIAMAEAGLKHLSQRHDPASYAAQLTEFMAESTQAELAYQRARSYIGCVATANAALQLPVTNSMAQGVAQLSALPGDAPDLWAAMGHASRVAAPAAPPHQRGLPMSEQTNSFAPGGAGSTRSCANTSQDLEALAARTQPRTALPSRMQHPWLDKLGVARWLLKAWNFVSREWREPMVIAHRILARHDAAGPQYTQLRAELRQQNLMLRAELVALEEQLAQLDARWQANPDTPRPRSTEPSSVSEQEHNFLQAVAQHFRGDPVQLRTRLSAHLPEVAQALARVPQPTVESVLDLGCGRGEWLGLVQEAGHSALGIDLSAECVATCQSQGLNVQLGDALRVLQQTPDQSVAVVTAFHLVEHLPLKGQITLFNEAWRVLAPGGLLLAETPNPENLRVISCNFWYDPTHQRPLPAEMLRVLAKSAGFTQIETALIQPPNISATEQEHYPPRLRHMLFCGEDIVIKAVKSVPSFG